MSALTSIFNFLYVFMRVLFSVLVGGHFNVSDFSNLEQQEIARQVVLNATNGAFENGIVFELNPILLLILGIFALGSIIGLARRLIKG